MSKIKLQNVTLVAVSSIKIPETKKALEVSQKDIEFYDVKLIADQDIRSSNEYSEFILYKLYKYIESDFALVIQYDGYVVRPEKWDDKFLQYDYIGAPWPANMHFTKEGVEVRVGNGGFSLRSKKLLNALNELRLPFTDNDTGFFHEDGIICNHYRKALEDYGIKFAPVDVAARFSKELLVPETVESFGFHKYKDLKKKYPNFENYRLGIFALMGKKIKYILKSLQKKLLK